MMKPQKDDYGKYKAATYGMGWSLLITLVMGYLFEDYALGLVLGLLIPQTARLLLAGYQNKKPLNFEMRPLDEIYTTKSISL